MLVGQRAMVKSHEDLDVYKIAFVAALKVFELSKSFPQEERYSLTDQIRRSSRSVCSGIAEAWRRRRYEAAFLNKLNESEAEAAETQVWLKFASKAGYMEQATAKSLYVNYDQVIGKLVNMIGNPKPWLMLKVGSSVEHKASANIGTEGVVLRSASAPLRLPLLRNEV